MRNRDAQVQIGTDVRTGQSVSIPMSAWRSTGTHLIGAAGFGKSYVLRSLIRHLIQRGQPFGLLDPHGDTSQAAMWMLRKANVRPANIVVLNPTDPEFSTAFNPLASVSTDPASQASFVLDAIAKAFGTATMNETPRLEGVARTFIRAAIDSDLSLLEVMEALSVDASGLRSYLIRNLTDELVRRDIAEFEKLPRADKIQVGESTRNRLRRLLQSPAVRLMLSQTEHTINFREVMDRGQIFIANLSNVAPEVQRLLGALVANTVLNAAAQRNPFRRRHWHFILDEFGQFATRDLANGLDGLRKFGVTVTAAHQRLDQLQREDPDVLSAMLTNAKIRLVMGGLSRPDAETMARELYTGSVTGSRVKHQLYSTKFRPVEDVFEVATESESSGDSWSASESASSAESESESYGLSESHVEHPELPDWDPEEHPFHRTLSLGWQTGQSRSLSAARGRGGSSVRSRTRSLVPITRHEEFSELSSIAYFSVPEEWERRIATVHSLPKREALLRVFNGPVQHIRTLDVQTEVIDDRWYRFQQLVMLRSEYVSSVVDVQRRLAERKKVLALKVAAAEDEGRPFDVRSFRQ